MSSGDSSNRRFERIDLRARVQVSSIDPERDPRTGATSYRDTDELCGTLSRGGAFIHSADPPAPGRRLLLQLHLPGGESVEAVARVAWTRVPLGATREGGIGVEFVAASGEAQGVIDRFLASARATAAPES